MVNWKDALTLSTNGCIGGTATYEILSTEGASIGSTLATGSMSSDGQGHYVATVGPLSPHHGAALVAITIVCPDGSVQNVQFDIYIDPSGVVVDQVGRPVSGAVVTLSRSDSREGPFVAVPDGSDLMSPANRANPMTTGATGHFGWDVVSGFYEVSAAKSGCTGATSDVLAVPPLVTDVRLVLTCANQDVQPPVITVTDQQLEGNTMGGWQGALPEPPSPTRTRRPTRSTSPTTHRACFRWGATW